MLLRRYRRLRQVLDRRQPDLTVLVENIHKPHNLSAILRTCDAVGVMAVHAINPTEGIPTFNQTARGSQKWVQLHLYDEIEEAIAYLKRQQMQILAANLAEDSLDYREIDFTQPTAILLGAEKRGVSDRAANLVDRQITIPMLGMVQSLNVSVAAATLLFEAQRQRLAAGFYNRVRLDPATYHRLLFEWSYPVIALQCRQEGKPYPALGEKGEILEQLER